ncbi:MAG TPA: bifunctional adenosylcobinamide kinase/adenosylcobinamide-phosphate guanylyltransferase [Chthoniobacterales bacterium]|nr:bifunctional adenosylcobinamide kinase/adenosylcobinamide-phosphate guanylyltransferase [Chthoniobacterales bacterium]
MSASLHLVLGGNRSGKSRRAEELAERSGFPVCYVATCATEAADEEMLARIAQHRQRRPSHWRTVENRFDLRAVMSEHASSLLLVDCLTLWLSFCHGQSRSAESVIAELEEALETARRMERGMILVSDEVGLGLVPSSPEGRAFRDLCGSANQLAASYATKVELVVAGLPLVLKGSA